MPTDDRSIFVQCECYQDAIHLKDDREDRKIEIAFWTLGYCGTGRMPWREALRWIWLILRTRAPYGDQVIISYDDARKIAEFLSQATK